MQALNHALGYSMIEENFINRFSGDNQRQVGQSMADKYYRRCAYIEHSFVAWITFHRGLDNQAYRRAIILISQGVSTHSIEAGL